MYRVVPYLLLLAAAASFAQGGHIKGFVTNEGGRPLAGIRIVLDSLAEARTDKHGSFAFANLPAGRHRMIIEGAGYSAAAKEIIIVPNQLHSVSLALERSITAPPIVVTGARGERELLSTPIPAQYIGAEKMAALGVRHASDLLFEQTGLLPDYTLGNGVRMQGLDAAYTMILVDGEPLIGRTRGTLELTRIPLAGIDHVEIVKGPSSSLYGSEALAGVINFITSPPSRDFRGSASVRYATHNTLDLNASGESAFGDVRGRITIGHLRSDGYDLTPETRPRTSSPYFQNSVQPKLDVRLTENLELKASGRYLGERQTNIVVLTENQSSRELADTATLDDWGAQTSLSYIPTNEFLLEGKAYIAGYSTLETLTEADGSVYDRAIFDQSTYKGEAFGEYSGFPLHKLSGGVGSIYDLARADRISGGDRSALRLYGFAQDEYDLLPQISLSGSLRYETHSDYASVLSPKFGLLWKATDALRVRALAGNGYKAPTFQQLYLDFGNPQVGYTVFGSANIQAGVAQLEAEGQIARYLQDPSALARIKPEHSWAYNLQVDWQAADWLRLSGSAFLNDLRDLIEAAPIAVKTNGQNVFTYFNLNRVRTQGVETSAAFTWRRDESSLPFDVSAEAGYQFLDAYDLDELAEVQAGKVFKPYGAGSVRPVKASEYGGLFNRSRHSGTLKLSVSLPDNLFTLAVRATVIGKYGFADLNLNGILDDNAEYAPGYTIVNSTLTYNPLAFMSLQAGMENALDVIQAQYVPALSGRKFFTNLAFKFN